MIVIETMTAVVQIITHRRYNGMMMVKMMNSTVTASMNSSKLRDGTTSAVFHYTRTPTRYPYPQLLTTAPIPIILLLLQLHPLHFDIDKDKMGLTQSE
jgi:hypothetical protein